MAYVSFVRLWTLLLAGCAGESRLVSHAYSPEQDDAALAAIASSWSDETYLESISLCENPDAVEDRDTCQVEHIVRGGGHGSAHTETFREGDDDCPRKAVAYVKGRWYFGAEGSWHMLWGTVELGTGMDGDDPYAFPYRLSLRCALTSPCSIDGMLHENGSLDFQRQHEGGGPYTESFQRGGSAICQ